MRSAPATRRIDRDEFAGADPGGRAPHSGDTEVARARAHACATQPVRHSPCAFVLLVPRPYWDPETEEAAKVIELAVPLLEQAVGARVEAIVGDTDPFVAVQAALERSEFDEVVVSTLPRRVSHWLRLDLPARVERLGVPVSVVEATQSDRAWEG